MKNKNFLLISTLIILLLLLIFYGLKVEINNNIVIKTLEIKKSMELKYSSMDTKYFDKIKELNNKIEKLSSGTFIDSGKGIIVTKKVKEKITKNNIDLQKIIISGNKGNCNKLNNKELIKLCTNNIYFNNALKKVDKSLCNKIKDSIYDLELCIKKVKKLEK